MAQVWNKRDLEVPDGAVDIMRPTQWGNPFLLTRERDRAKIVADFEKYILAPEQRYLLAQARRALYGRDLVCTCKPKACHGDIWLRWCNPQPDEHGNLLVRANGGNKTHILAAEERKLGSAATSMCGHQPSNKSHMMKQRGKWLHTLQPVGHVTCEKCASAYERN